MEDEFHCGKEEREVSKCSRRCKNDEQNGRTEDINTHLDDVFGFDEVLNMYRVQYVDEQGKVGTAYD